MGEKGLDYDELWSQHDNNLGLVKSAMPIHIKLKKEHVFLGSPSIH